MKKGCPNTLIIKLSALGLGGNPLIAWVLGCLYLAIPSYDGKGILSTKVITPHLILQNINKLGRRATLEDDV